MKIHKPLFYGIVECLDETFNQGYYADKVLERKFKMNKKWGKRDRGFIAENFYDIVRWWRWLGWLALGQQEPKASHSKEDLESILSTWLFIHHEEIPQWCLEHINQEAVLNRKKETVPFGVRNSYPDWMVEKVETELKQDGLESLIEQNQLAHIYLRTNTFTTSDSLLVAKMKEEGIQLNPVEGQAHCFRLEKRTNVFKTQAFKDGWFEVQDAGSQRIAPLLQVEPGMRVVDGCAGAGGKSLHLANMMNNKGKIVALDIHEWKLRELKKRAARAKCDIIETRAIDNSKVIKRLKGTADRVLLDVPCSGIGVLKRNPDTKWKLTQEGLDEVQGIQKDILERYSQFAKPDGKLVYATCSILPSENQKQVEAFLSQNPQWFMEEEIIILPGQSDSDGFYAARLAQKS